MSEVKTALVTGASQGIGRAIALALADQGMNVAVADIAPADAETVQETISLIEKKGVKAFYCTCNVADLSAAQSCVEQVLGAFGSVDVLVNNAGITRDKLVMQMTEEDFDSVISVNLKGAFNMIKACIRTFIRQKGGRIVNIASVVGMMGNAGQANYAASKAGVIGLTKSVAREYAAKGVICNAVCPGFIETSMTAKMTDSAKAKMSDMIPMIRLGQPEDVADAVVFLAKTPYVTGETIRVDGGMYI